ncbi:unnamed protein product [Meganyctiphanes norvegica]|uniref:Tetraspanin n=1 Tax=Meganyctiphanes norvegica TaxID=48144 RepID=A0AAV2PNN4_MEGNR
MGCCDCIFGTIKGGINLISKTLLMGFNGFFMVQGLTITIVMIVAMVLVNALTVEGGETLGFITTIQNIATGVLVFGITILLTSFLGCFGACCKNQCMLITYAVILVALIIGQITMVSMAVSWREDVEDDLKEDWEGELEKYDPSADFPRKEIDGLQKDWSCCGVNTFEDWKINSYLSTNHSVPDSCCKNVTVGCGYDFFNHVNSTMYDINKEGCYDAVRGNIMPWFEFVWIFIIIIILVQAVLVVAASCLAWKTKKGG